jgi:hypothetical protein
MKKIISALVFSLLAVGVAPAAAIDPPAGWSYPVPAAPTIVSQSDPFCSEPDKRCDGVSVVINTPTIPNFDPTYMSALYLKVGTTGASISNGQQGVVVTGLAYGKAHTAVISYFTSEGPLWVTHYGESVSFTTIPMANATPTPSVEPAPSRIPFTQPCAGGTDRTPGLPQCLMPEGLGGSAWNLVDNNSGVVLNGAVCSEGVCGRNGEWRQWPADRKLNDRLWPTGYPEGATYIQTPFDSAYWGRYFTNGVYEVNGGGILQPGSRTIIWPVQTPAPRVDTATVTSETSTSTSAPETSTPISTPSPTPTPTPAPSSEPRGLGGYAVIHPQGYVCGVIVGNAYFGNNDRTMTSEYMGCPVGSPIIFQTKPSPTGNVAGWHGANVTYSGGVFTIRNNGLVAMTISDGIATDSTGRMWDTGSGATLRAATVVTPSLPSQGETATVTSAPSSGSSNTGLTTDTRTATMPLETTTAIVPVAIPPADDDLSSLDEIVPEEEIIDSIEAVVQSNGTTRIQVSTGYNLTAMTVVATKKGSKKKYTYRITTNADGERKFKSGLNLRGYTVVLLKGSTELDRMYIS